MPYWQVFPAVRAALFESVRPGYSQLRVPAAEIKPSIFGHEEFTAFNATATQIFDKWKKDVIPLHSTLVTLLRASGYQGTPLANLYSRTLELVKRLR
jgi:type I restriction enzyme M protein